jgi:hypothetical protein
MYIPKTKNQDDLAERAVKLTKMPTSNKAPADLLQSSFIPAQIISLGAPMVSPVNLPAGVISSSLMDSLALSCAIESIGQAVNDERILSSQTLTPLVESSAKAAEINTSTLEILAKSSKNILAISSLAELGAGQMHLQETNSLFPIQNMGANALPAKELSSMDMSLLPAGKPVMISQSSAGENSSVTLINKTDTKVKISDFRAEQAEIHTFINTGLGTLIVTTPTTNLTSLSLTGKVEFIATGMEVDTGITVSGAVDSSGIVLYILGDTSGVHGASNVVNLGDGNNVVFGAGDGPIFISLGSGSNAVILTGEGASGAINFSAHADSTSNFVAVAANGLSFAQALANTPLIELSGLNLGLNSSDAITFLSDVSGDLIWAGGTAQSAQIQSINQGHDGYLASWINAAQERASQAHSIAWFQFDGATYILETVFGSNGSRESDTLVKLVGTTTFNGVYGELSQGTLHF